MSASDEPFVLATAADISDQAMITDSIVSSLSDDTLNVILPTTAAAAIAQTKTTANSIASDEYHFASVSMAIFFLLFSIFRFIYLFMIISFVLGIFALYSNENRQIRTNIIRFVTLNLLEIHFFDLLFLTWLSLFYIWCSK